GSVAGALLGCPQSGDVGGWHPPRIAGGAYRALIDLVGRGARPASSGANGNEVIRPLGGFELLAVLDPLGIHTPDAIADGFPERRLLDVGARGEGQPVDRRGPEGAQPGPMLRRRVALVAGEVVAGVLAVELDHEPVPEDLRDDRRRGHGRA